MITTNRHCISSIRGYTNWHLLGIFSAQLFLLWNMLMMLLFIMYTFPMTGSYWRKEDFLGFLMGWASWMSAVRLPGGKFKQNMTNCIMLINQLGAIDDRCIIYNRCLASSHQEEILQNINFISWNMCSYWINAEENQPLTMWPCCANYKNHGMVNHTESKPGKVKHISRNL